MKNIKSNTKLTKILAIALAMTLVMTCFAFAAELPSDVKGQTYEKAVAALMEKNIITGDEDGLYHSDDILNRAQACIIVVKTMSPPQEEVVGTPSQPAPKSGFKDMGGYGWAEGYINYAVKTGVTKGYGNGKFGPSDKVSSDQLVTMVLRAAGYKDSTLGGTWPTNYVDKAKELGAYENIPENMQRADNAPKWVAAQMDFNMLDEIIAADLKPTSDKPTPDEDKFIPGTTKMTFGTGSFNADINSYAGKQLSKDVIIYNYGNKSEYKEDMKLPEKTSDFAIGNVFKYKNAKTPCFYNMSGGKIVNMIIPMDAGFSGRIYGVINGTSTEIDGNKEKVPALDTLASLKEITWQGKNGLTLPESTEYLGGVVYEMNSNDGIIESVVSPGGVGLSNTNFKELTDVGGFGWKTIDGYSSNVVTFGSTNLITIKNNAAVYVLEKGKYTPASISSIKKGKSIRAYDVLDDKEIAADVVVIKD